MIKANQAQSEGYTKVLTYMAARLNQERVDIQPEEIKLINLIRVILQGGWIIDTNVLQECLKLTGLEVCQGRYLEWLEERTRTEVKPFNKRDMTVL